MRLCACGQPTANRRYCTQACYRAYRPEPIWRKSVPPMMRRKLTRTLEDKTMGTEAAL